MALLDDFRCFPPGTTIFPALLVRARLLPTSAARGLGNPSAFLWRRVRRFSTGGSGGGGVAAGDGTDDNELTESADEPGADRSGVSSSSASTLMVLAEVEGGTAVTSALNVRDLDAARELLFALFATLWELSDI